MDTLNYGRMMQRAMQGLVAEALRSVAEHGLPDEHHFYISFMTTHPGVDMPEWLREQHPSEMMIVLQYEYKNLAVTSDRFSVELSFNNRPATLVIPFDAVLQFADPSAEFGLRFDPTDGVSESAEAVEEAEAPSSDDAEPHDGERPEAEVVSLDAFRKKS